MATYQLSVATGTVQTTDAATTTTVATFTVPTGTSIRARAIVIGRSAANVSISREIAMTAADVAGTLAQDGTTDVTLPINGNATLAATATITMDVSGNTIRVRVTGLIATTINWYARVDVFIYAP